jgi:hypothetical protein
MLMEQSHKDFYSLLFLEYPKSIHLFYMFENHLLNWMNKNLLHRHRNCYKYYPLRINKYYNNPGLNFYLYNNIKFPP